MASAELCYRAIIGYFPYHETASLMSSLDEPTSHRRAVPEHDVVGKTEAEGNAPSSSVQSLPFPLVH